MSADDERDEREWVGDFDREPRRRDPGRCWLPDSHYPQPCRGPIVAGLCRKCERPAP